MKNKYFKCSDTLKEITDKYPVLIPILVNNGFSQLEDEAKRKQFGSRITLKQAAQLKQINLEKLEELLLNEIESKHNKIDVTLKNERKKNAEFKVEGLLPCPVRVPLLEELEGLIDNIEPSVILNLKAASQGLDWLKDEISQNTAADDLADIFISAGFDLFFDQNLMEGFRQQGIFKDSTGINQINKDFSDQGINLIDPEGDYSIIGTVPAVFLINHDELKGRSIPRTWEDVLSPQFDDDVSLPVSDFDLFNAILLNIYQKYGKKGVRKLAHSLKKSLHPSQMVKNGGKKKENQPAITIMPYFFTRMAHRFQHMEFVWPEDGAIISPIFMLIKESSLPEIQPLVDFFSSEKVGKILAEQGLFPSILPGIENNLPDDAKFMWPGWEFLRQKDPGSLIIELTDEFNSIIREVS